MEPVGLQSGDDDEVHHGSCLRAAEREHWCQPQVGPRRFECYGMRSESLRALRHEELRDGTLIGLYGEARDGRLTLV